MASQQETNLVALGKSAYEAAIAVRGNKDKLAKDLGFASGGSMGICADRIFYGKVAPSRQSGNEGNGERKPRATSNTVSALRQALEDMKSVGLIAEVPSLHVGPVDALTVNPAISQLIQPYFDASPLNAAFCLAFRHVPISQLKEFGLISNEMREADKVERQLAMDKEIAAKDYLRSRGYEVIVADHLADDIATWSLRLIESSDFEIGLLHEAETKAAIAETERLAAIAAENAANELARQHDAAIVAENIAIDATAIAERAAMEAELAAMRAELAELKAAKAAKAAKDTAPLKRVA
jgi:hypothetical protein